MHLNKERKMDIGAYAVVMNDGSELYHHGILGMKWGVRKYQNEDGTLTPAGKERYGSDIDKYKTKVENKLSKIETKVEKKQKKATKLYTKADIKVNRMLFPNEKKASKLYRKADKAQRKVNTLEYKGKKYYQKSSKNMTKVDSSDSLTQKSIALGEKFVSDVNNRASAIYINRAGRI
jgi:hypothetical protein